MNIIENLIYAAGHLYDFKVPPSTLSVTNPRPVINGDFLNTPDEWSLPTPWANSAAMQVAFTHFDDPGVIDKAIQKHWFDIADHVDGISGSPKYSGSLDYDFGVHTPYHLVYAYLIENSRISQIFERVIAYYHRDETLGIAETLSTAEASQWLHNTEALFYKELAANRYSNITSQLRGVAEASRRNAYMRLLGMDLAFGDHFNNNQPYNYSRPQTFNSTFVPLFEFFLREIWQAYTNAKNTSGANTTDYDHITELGLQLQDMLMARRAPDANGFAKYRYFNLSKEEYSSVVMMSWLYWAIQSNTSIVQHLRCDANTPHERLEKIGMRVGLPPHSKAKPLFEMAVPMGALLRTIEEGYYTIASQVRLVIESYANVGSPTDQAALDDLLTIINNWEKSTGHRIKNPESVLSGKVRVLQSAR